MAHYLLTQAASFDDEATKKRRLDLEESRFLLDEKVQSQRLEIEKLRWEEEKAEKGGAACGTGTEHAPSSSAV
jgi:hypothetical protein